MPRTGIEAKPPWRTIAPAVRRSVHGILGADVRRAARVWGGYSPTPTFRLRLADGRRAFLKAVGPRDNDFSRAALAREARVYAELGDLIGPWAPQFYGSLRDGDWHALLLEDLGPKSVPPWTAAAARGVSRAFADFHRSTQRASYAAWLPRPVQFLAPQARLWERLMEAEDLPALAALAGAQSPAAIRWLSSAVSVLSRAGHALASADGTDAFLHCDTRSDNLRWRRGELRLFDWPHVGVGPAEYDLAAFAQSVTVEGGPDPEQIATWYGERAPVRDDLLDAAVATIAGYFAAAAWREEIPGLPRLRQFQRAQLRVTLTWAAQRLRLPPPTWLGSVPC